MSRLSQRAIRRIHLSRLSPPLFQLSAVRATSPLTSFSRCADGNQRGVPDELKKIQHPLSKRSLDLLCLLPMSVRALSRSHFLMRSSIQRHHVSSTGFTVTLIPSLIFERFGRYSFCKVRRIPLSFGSHIVRAGASYFQRPADFRQLSRRDCLTKLFGSILLNISLRMRPNGALISPSLRRRQINSRENNHSAQRLAPRQRLTEQPPREQRAEDRFAEQAHRSRWGETLSNPIGRRRRRERSEHLRQHLA